jgi:fructokinase
MNMAKLNKRVALAACIGNDGFGNFIQQQLSLSGVSPDYLQITSQAPTTLSINTRQTLTPDFVIYRGADAYLHPAEGLHQAALNSHIIHTSAFALSREPARSTILGTLQAAHQSGCLISLDPNYHPHIWPDIDDFRKTLQLAFQFVALTKPSLDDCSRLFGPGLTPSAYAEQFLEWGPKIVALTMGQDGVFLALANGARYHIHPNTIPVVDVTGAGDAFWAGMLSALLNGSSPLEAAQLGQVVAEVKVGKVGPISHMPDWESLQERAESGTWLPTSQTVMKTNRPLTNKRQRKGGARKIIMKQGLTEPYLSTNIFRRMK